MMKQFLAIKAGCPDAVVFYRMGDFYEMFLEDAELAAPLLDITLTTRDRGKPDAVPMCGVPVHAADAHIKRLAELGHRVAICEQVEDPKQVGPRKLVRREVVEVVTPGLVGDPAGLDARREVAVASVLPGTEERGAGLAALDASKGSFQATHFEAPGARPAALVVEIARIGPRAGLLPEDDFEALSARLAEVLPGTAFTAVDGSSFAPADIPAAPAGFRDDPEDPAMSAAAAVLRYVEHNQPFALRQTARLRSYSLSDAMVLDAATRAHLELFESSEDRSRRGTLIERIDETATPLGARRLARWVAYPLLDPETIRTRQDGVAWLAERDRKRGRLRAALGAVRDLERLLAVAARPGATPRDLAALRGSVLALPAVRGFEWIVPRPGRCGRRCWCSRSRSSQSPSC